MSQIQLLKRAVRLFPRTAYTDPQAALYARRQWLKSVAYLRGESQTGWVIDKRVERKHEQDSYLLVRQAG
jgi:hypothetical protein